MVEIDDEMTADSVRDKLRTEDTVRVAVKDPALRVASVVTDTECEGDEDNVRAVVTEMDTSSVDDGVTVRDNVTVIDAVPVLVAEVDFDKESSIVGVTVLVAIRDEDFDNVISAVCDLESDTEIVWSSVIEPLVIDPVLETDTDADTATVVDAVNDSEGVSEKVKVAEIDDETAFVALPVTSIDDVAESDRDAERVNVKFHTVIVTDRLAESDEVVDFDNVGSTEGVKELETDFAPVSDRLGLPERLPDTEKLRLIIGLMLRLIVMLMVLDRVLYKEADNVALTEPVTVSLALRVTDGDAVIDAERLQLRDAEPVGDADAVRVTELVSVDVAEPVPVGEGVTLSDREYESLAE